MAAKGERTGARKWSRCKAGMPGRAGHGRVRLALFSTAIDRTAVRGGPRSPIASTARRPAPFTHAPPCPDASRAASGLSGQTGGQASGPRLAGAVSVATQQAVQASRRERARGGGGRRRRLCDVRINDVSANSRSASGLRVPLWKYIDLSSTPCPPRPAHAAVGLRLALPTPSSFPTTMSSPTPDHAQS